MPFDPNKPFVVDDGDKSSGFDPNKPFTTVDASKTDEGDGSYAEWAGRKAASIARGLGPVAAGAAAGGAAGSMLGGVGAIPGAAAGALAVGGTELALSTYNALARATGLPEAMTPDEATDKLFDALGVARPKTAGDRMLRAAAGAAGGAYGQAAGAAAKAAEMGPGVAREVLRTLGENPAMQAAAGAASGTAAQGVAEVGGGPLAQTMASLGAGALTGAASSGAGTVKEAVLPSAKDPYAAAVTAVNRRLKEAGLTAEELLAKKAEFPDKPMTLRDVSGRSLEDLGGSVARSPTSVGARIRTFLEGRDKAAGDRMMADLAKEMKTDSVLQTTRALAEGRKAVADPLYELAFQGGSVAPLETQYQNAWDKASKRVADLTKERDKLVAESITPRARMTTTEDVYTTGSEGAKLRDNQARMAKIDRELLAAQEDKEITLDHLRRAQADRESGAPGALWTPTIARLLSNPRIKTGIRRGIEIERDLADSEGRPMNLREYAVTGIDENGDPIVSRVPNTRLLAAAKKGLDSMLEAKGMRDELTGRFTEEGRAVDKLRSTLLRELRENNDTYAQANDIWAGETQSMEAVREGRKSLDPKTNPEETAEYVAGLTSAQKEFGRMGVADTIRTKILKAGFDEDEAKKIINSKWAKMQLAPWFDSPEAAERYMNSVLAERSMFQSAAKDLSGSATAQRLAQDRNLEAEKDRVGEHLADAGVKAAKQSYLSAAKSMFKAFKAYRERGGTRNEDFENAVAQIVFNPDVNLEDLTAPAALPPPARRVGATGVPAGILGALGVSPVPAGDLPQ